MPDKLAIKTSTIIEKDFMNMSYKDFKNKYMRNKALSSNDLLQIFQENCKSTYKYAIKQNIAKYKEDICKIMDNSIDTTFDGWRIERASLFDYLTREDKNHNYLPKNGKIDVSELDAIVKFTYQGKCHDARKKAKKPYFISDNELNNLKMSQILDYLMERIVPYKYYDKKEHKIILDA